MPREKNRLRHLLFYRRSFQDSAVEIFNKVSIVFLFHHHSNKLTGTETGFVSVFDFIANDFCKV